MPPQHQPKGQSLIEIIVAVGVVLFVLVSIAAVVIINSFGQKVSEYRIIGSNLAREGIEVVRNLRDSAELHKQTLADETATIYSTAFHYYTLTGIQSNRWTLARVTGSLGTDSELKLLNNLYQVTADASAVRTPYRRTIVIDTLCDGSVLNECGNQICENGEADECNVLIGYRVTSQVQWLENNQPVTYQLAEFLYDWR